MNWGTVRLGDVCFEDKIIIDGNLSSKPYLGLEMIESGTGMINWSNKTSEGISSCYSFDSRHILYGKLRPYLNKVALPEVEGRCSTEIIPLLPKSNICREYIAFLLRCKETIDYVMPENTGSRMPRADMNHLLNMEIILPHFSEQQRIAVEIKRQLAIVEKAKQAAVEQLTAARSLNAAYLREVFDDNEWERVRLGSVGNVCMCKRVFKDQTQSTGDIPFYKIGTFGGKADAFISRDIYNTYVSQFPFPQKGDVLISAAGTLGRAVMYDGEPAYFQDSNIVWIDNDESKALNSYLFYVYATNPWIGIDGAIIARLYNDNIREAIIPGKQVIYVALPDRKRREKSNCVI